MLARVRSTITGQSENLNGRSKPIATSRPRRILGDISNVTERAPPPAVIVSKPVVMEVEDERSYMNRAPTNIDLNDVENSMACTEVVNELMARNKEVEGQFLITDYMPHQTQLNQKMRCILIDWLVSVHGTFKMVPETLYLTVNIMDRYLATGEAVKRSKLQLVGITAMLLASKYEEIYPPSLEKLLRVTENAYTKREVLTTEANICNALQYQFTVPNSYVFLCRYLKAGSMDKLTMVQLCCYLNERMLQEYSMLRFRPSVVAAAVVSVARRSSNRFPWSPTLLKYTQYDEADIAECLSEMEKILSVRNTEQTAVEKKYSNAKYGGVASTPLFFS